MILPPLFCFGYGFSARHLGQRFLAEGGRVMATARDAQKREALAAQGIEALPFPVPDLAARLPDGVAVLISAAPNAEGDPVLSACRDALIEARGKIAWIGYLSTTAVYGDHQGGEVDEDTPTAPVSERGARRVEAERAWLSLGREHDLPVHVFRLAGIYGRGRGPFEKLRAGRSQMVIKPGQVFGRIHGADIAETLLASMRAPKAGRVYNVTDDVTCPPQEVIAHAAGLLGLPAPPEMPFEKADLTPMARSFYGENKRVSNRRIKEELGVRLNYPSYREGLAAILAEEAEE